MVLLHREQEKEKASSYRAGTGSEPGQEKDRNESVLPRPVSSQAVRSRAEHSLEETAKRLKAIEVRETALLTCTTCNDT